MIGVRNSHDKSKATGLTASLRQTQSVRLVNILINASAK